MEYVVFSGITERYPRWFQREIERTIGMDDSRYTFWIPETDRDVDYYEKQLVEDYSIFLRKPNGEVHLTDYDVFKDLYTSFKFNAFNNSGICAFRSDCITYVECKPGVLTYDYPDWFYEYFTEAVHSPNGDETILLHSVDSLSRSGLDRAYVSDKEVSVSVTKHCVFLRNRFGEIKGMDYEKFLKFYDPFPKIGGYYT